MTDAVFEEDKSTGLSVRPASRLPLYALWAISLGGVIVALLDRLPWSWAAYGVLVVAAFVLLFRYRLALVRRTRSADSGTGAVVGVKRMEWITMAAVAAGCAANGVVIGRWVASLEVWFK